MKKTGENLHYFQQKDIQFSDIQNQPTVSKLQYVTKQQKIKQKRSKNRFFLELENQYDQLFDNESFVSKRSLKQKKLQQKMNILSQQNFHNQKNQSILLPCQEDISSISFINDQGTPDDSIFSKLIKQSGMNRNQQCQSSNLQQQLSSQNVSLLNSEMMQDEASEKSFFISQTSQHNQSSEIQVQENHQAQSNKNQDLQKKQGGLINKIEYAFKKSSMQFQKVNRYLLKFLKTTVDGILVLPEYSSRLEDCSELGAQGKMLQLKITQPKKSEINLNINKILSQQLHQCSNEQKIQDNDLQQFKQQTKCFKKQKKQENENNQSHHHQTENRNQFSPNIDFDQNST